MKKYFIPLLLVGCATTEDDRICLDWGHYPTVEERCIPLYGNVICTTEETTRYWCKLYEEKDEKVTTSSNTNRDSSSS